MNNDNNILSAEFVFESGPLLLFFPQICQSSLSQ